jgi:hypothetical protein
MGTIKTEIVTVHSYTMEEKYDPLYIQAYITLKPIYNFHKLHLTPVIKQKLVLKRIIKIMLY